MFLSALSEAVGIKLDLSKFAESAAQNVTYDPTKTNKSTPDGYYDPKTGKAYVYKPAFGPRSEGDYVSTTIHENFHVVSGLEDPVLIGKIGIALRNPSLGSSGTVAGSTDHYFAKYCGPNPRQFP
jgi:hypothetical protein